MHLIPRELDKLVLHGAGALAQKRLARGLRLTYPEAVALVSTVLLELVRDGHTVAALMDVGRRILGLRQVLPGVATMIHEVQIEGTFPDGTKLVTVHDPIVLEDGDLALALHGSFLPTPTPEVFDRPEAWGGLTPADFAAAPGGSPSRLARSSCRPAAPARRSASRTAATGRSRWAAIILLRIRTAPSSSTAPPPPASTSTSPPAPPSASSPGRRAP